MAKIPSGGSRVCGGVRVSGWLIWRLVNTHRNGLIISVPNSNSLSVLRVWVRRYLASLAHRDVPPHGLARRKGLGHRGDHPAGEAQEHEATHSDLCFLPVFFKSLNLPLKVGNPELAVAPDRNNRLEERARPQGSMSPFHNHRRVRTIDKQTLSRSVYFTLQLRAHAAYGTG